MVPASPTPLTPRGLTSVGVSARSSSIQGIIRALNHSGYQGPLTVEWEDPMMDREFGAGEAENFVRRLDFPRSGRAFDAAFAEG